MTKSAKAALRIVSEKFASAEISALLELQPTRARDVGAPVGPRSPGKLNPRTVWSLDAAVSPDAPLEDHIAAIVGVMERRREEILSLREFCSVDVFCYFSSENGQGGIELDATLMRRLSDLGADLLLDLYLSDNDDAA